MKADSRLPEESPSFSGSARYLDVRPGSREAQPRVYVRFRPVGAETPQLALLDTGAHYCILDRDLASRLGDHLTGPIGQVGIRTAYGLLKGNLHTHSITLIADSGTSLDIESIVLISPDWRGPSFLGYMGALDRLRFAVDPRRNRFFFGSLA